MTVSELAVAWKLVVSHMRHRPGRVLLTSLSTIAAACVVVWVVSGYDSLVGQFGGMGDEYVGRYEVLLMPARDVGNPGDGETAAPGPMPGGFGRPSAISKETLDAVRKDPDVVQVDTIFETSLRVPKPTDPNTPRIPFGSAAPGGAGKSRNPADGVVTHGGIAEQNAQPKVPTVVGTDSTEPVHKLLHGAWFDSKNHEPQGAMTREAADYLGVKVGDEVSVSSGGGLGTRGGRAGGGGDAGDEEVRPGIKVKVVGIVEQPKRLPRPKAMTGLPQTQAASLQSGPAAHAVYVSMPVAEQLSGITARATYAGVVLKPGASADGFVSRMSPSFSSSNPRTEARTPEKIDSEVADSTTFDSVRAQAYSATAISLMASLFIIFTTLSMGVDERVRLLAMMRAIGLTRAQVAAMVAFEAVMLGMIGWAGGLLAGWGLLKILAREKPEMLSEGSELGQWCVILSGVCALGGSLAASVIPAWRAVRVRPLEAMVPRQQSGPGRMPWLLGVLGLLLISVNPLIVFYIPMPEKSRYIVSAAVGCTTMVVGFVLLAPLAVILVERLLGPLLALALRLNGRLLATQLSANLWRTVGTTVALTIGLGLFVATQTWGYSMLAPFTPGPWSPDMIVTVPAGVSDADLDAVRHVPGLKPEQFLPLAVKQVKFAEDPTGRKSRESTSRQDNCVMIGIDPDAGIGGNDPAFQFEFEQGNRAEAAAKLKQGRFCLVPDHFARESGLGLGGKFKVLSGDRDSAPLEYEIAGVVSESGWQWLTKGFRRGRAAGLMFADFERIRTDFKTGRVTAFWGNTNGTANEDDIKKSIQAIVEKPKEDWDPEAIKRRFERRDPQAPAPAPTAPAPAGGRGPGAFGGPGRGTVSILTAEAARIDIRKRADHIIWALSELPLITLLVSSIGVINTVISAVRARRWDLGVLRALGVTRFGLFRLIVAESLLIGIVACLLSLAFGTLAGYCGTGVTRYVNIRGGMVTPLVVPWAKLGIGFSIAVGLCLLAALWPAFRAGRAEPLRLLQSGRAAG